jgi:diguanylate cyclase (GGDEF) domain
MRFIYKFIILITVIIVTGTVAQITAVDKFFLRDTDSLMLDINQKAAENESIQLMEYFAKIENSLEVIATDEKSRVSQESLDTINKVIPEVDVLTVLDLKGDVLLVSGNKYDLEYTNLSFRDYFKQAIQGRSYISDVYTATKDIQVVSIAVPAFKNGAIDGVIVGIVKLHENSLSSLFDNKEFGRKGYISIIDRQGNTVYHPSKNRIGQKFTDLNELDGQAGSEITKDFSGKYQYSGYSKVSNLDWTVIVNTPTDDVMKNRNSIVKEILFRSIALNFIIIVLSSYLVRRYTEPLHKLIMAFNSLKSGKYKKIDYRNYNKEFHEIVRVYNNTIGILEEDHKNLEQAAEIDSLTGANNRRAFDNLISIYNQEIKNNRSLKKLGLLLLDIDHFKSLNDSSGHIAGDNVLKDLTKIMKSIAGEQVVYRLGGDEFAVVIANTSDRRLIFTAEAIRRKSEASLLGCTVSIGIAKYPQNTNSVVELMELADKALYISKKSKNKVTFYEK